MNNNDEKTDEYVLKKLLHLFLFLVGLVVSLGTLVSGVDPVLAKGEYFGRAP